LSRAAYALASRTGQVVFFWHYPRSGINRGGGAMTDRQTERPHAQAPGLELRADADILALLAEGQAAAAASVGSAIGDIARGAALAAASIAGGGRLIYAAAGSSGLMALADALELPGTYGIARDRIAVLLA